MGRKRSCIVNSEKTSWFFFVFFHGVIPNSIHYPRRLPRNGGPVTLKMDRIVVLYRNSA
jgi:hypothetical protein